MNDSALKTGYFVFSLDSELAWGYFDCFKPKMFSKDGQRERKYLELLLDVLDEFNITATWSIVGYLFNKQYESCDSYPIKTWREKFSPTFEKLYRIGSPLLYGSDFIETLLTRGTTHEIAFHGFTHRVFNEENMNEEEAKWEIQQWLKKSIPKNIIPKTVVFPRNKIGYLEIFKEFGFICYRGEEPMSRLYSLSFIGRIFRRYYYYLSTLSTPKIYDLQVDQSGLVNLPSSRWLFGFNRKLERLFDSLNLHTLRLRKMVEGIKKAALEKKIIHIWAHPYEFQTKKDLEKLRYLLSCVAEEVNAGRMQSVSMAELAEKAIEKRQQMNGY